MQELNRRNYMVEALSLAKLTEPKPVYDPSNMDEALDRGLSLMSSQLANAPSFDDFAFIALWSTAMRDEEIEAGDIERAVVRVCRKEEFFPRLARFLRYCRAERDERHRDWLLDMKAMKEHEAKALPCITREEADAIKSRMSEGAAELLDAVLEAEVVQ